MSHQKIFIFITIIIVQICQLIQCSELRLKETEILDYISSPERYDIRLLPPSNNESGTKVLTRVNIFVRSILAIDDQKMEYSVQLTFRQMWTDTRLKYDNLKHQLEYITLSKSGQIWEPDLFFSNENNGHFHDMMVPNVYYKIYPSGSVMYNRRLSLTLGCSMDLTLYPFDLQTCQIRISTYKYTAEVLRILWKEGEGVYVSRNLNLAKFTLHNYTADYCNVATGVAEYSCLVAKFLFKRNIYSYLIQIYLPSIILVLISWTSFWFDPADIRSRIFIGLTTLFVVLIQTSLVNFSVPQVSYTKAIDIWTGVCVTFVFLAFLELVTVHYIYRSKLFIPIKTVLEVEDVEQIVPGNDADSENTALNHSSEALTPESKRSSCKTIHNLNCCKIWFKRFSSKAKALDVFSRILFPAFFIFFNLIYWLCYTI